MFFKLSNHDGKAKELPVPVYLSTCGKIYLPARIFRHIEML